MKTSLTMKCLQINKINSFKFILHSLMFLVISSVLPCMKVIMNLYKNESGYEALNPENELWKGGNYHDTQAFF